VEKKQRGERAQSLGGMLIALFVAWRVGGAARERAFQSGTRFGQIYWT